jgi:hypothetical protein
MRKNMIESKEVLNLALKAEVLSSKLLAGLAQGSSESGGECEGSNFQVDQKIVFQQIGDSIMVLASFGTTNNTNTNNNKNYTISRDSLEEFVNREVLSIMKEHFHFPSDQVAKQFKI